MGMLVMGTAVALTGCMRPISRTTQNQSAVAIRWVLPQEGELFSNSAASYNAHLASSGYTGYTGNVEGFSSTTLVSDIGYIPTPDARHVALWGNGFKGHDVTYALTSLTPGQYTFAYFDADRASAMQGWVDVNLRGDDLIDTLRSWKAMIPQYKQQVAYDFEIKGGIESGDPHSFHELRHELQAFDWVEKEIDKTIKRELKRCQAHRFKNDQLINSAQVLLLPSEGGLFHPTTDPAFTPEEVNQVRNGQPLSKMLLVADYDDAQWKLQHVNELTRDMIRIKSVLLEEVDRLQRLQRYYSLTDHLYHHNKKFVKNQWKIELTLATIDKINLQIGQLRERRLALAFVNELFAGNDAYQWIEQERRELMQERAVLDTQKQRVELLFNECEANSARRVAFERERQEIIRATEALDDQVEQLSSARVAIQSLKNSTQVIHRQGDTRLLAASFIDADIPFRVREAVSRESMMTVRLQPTDRYFAPPGTEVLKASQKMYESEYQQNPSQSDWGN
jgi:hypothetical protein